MLRKCWVLAACATAAAVLSGPAAADQLAAIDPLLDPWPNGHIISKIDGEAMRFPSASPFALFAPIIGSTAYQYIAGRL